MKQLYAAGHLRDRASFRPANGHADVAPAPAVRAVSAGLKPAELQAALSYAGYFAPAEGARPLPVRLALLHTPAGRLLTHVTPNGGTFFAHSLLNVPATADAQLAIQTWGSPFWQRHEPESACEL